MTTMRLLLESDNDTFQTTYRLQPELWLEAVKMICDRHGITWRKITPFVDGANLVAAIDQCSVVKIYPPHHRCQWEAEWRTLKHIENFDLPVEVPKLIVHGECLDSWMYTVMSWVDGTSLEVVWPTLGRDEKAIILSEIGELMAKVHRVSSPGSLTIQPEWSFFITQQHARCQERHERQKLPERLTHCIPEYLVEVSSLQASIPVLLTGEYTPFNLLVSKCDGRWHLSGMIDFGDAMVGLHEYDLLGPCLFLASGDPSLVGSLLDSYGYTKEKRSPSLRRRLMSLTLMHRYSNLEAQVRIEGWLDSVNDLEQLAQLLFPWDDRALPTDLVKTCDESE